MPRPSEAMIELGSEAFGSDAGIEEDADHADGADQHEPALAQVDAEPAADRGAGGGPGEAPEVRDHGQPQQKPNARSK